MAEGALYARAIQGVNVAVMTASDRLLVRESDGLDELLSLRATLRTKAAGRGRWLLWTWLILLSGGTITFEGENATAGLFLIPLMLVGLVLIVSYVVRTRNRANYAEDWLSEIDFRLAQLAAKG